MYCQSIVAGFGGQSTKTAEGRKNDWILSKWLRQEPDWLLAMYTAVEET
jgi:hypothetical protein